MPQDLNEQKLIEAIENSVSNGNEPKDIQSVVYYLNKIQTITPSIRSKMNSLLSDMDFYKIKKAVQLLECLTYYNKHKLAQIINDDKLLEYVSHTLSGDYLLLQEAVLNLIKYWMDEFADMQQEVNLVFQLIENLEVFGISLPDSYQPSFDQVPLESKEEEIEFSKQADLENQEPSRFHKTLNQVKELQQEQIRVLSTIDIEPLSTEGKRNKLHLLLTKNFSLCTDFSEIRTEVTLYQKQMEEALKTLQKSRVEIHDKLSKLGNPPLPDPPGAQSHSPAGEPFKIVVSEADNRDYYGQESKIMEVEQLLGYKTVMCSQGAICPHAPSLFHMDPDEIEFNNVLQCVYWHNPQDRRRAVFSESLAIAYGSKMCSHWNMKCVMGDKCSESHNYLESLFHPFGYKKKKCRFPNTCRNGKYCPYYHDVDEREEWEETCQQYFGQNSTAPQDNNENENNQVENTWKVGEVGTYPPRSSNLLDIEENRLPTKEKPEHKANDIRPSAFQKYGTQNQSNNEHASFLSKEQQEEVPEGILHSKLIIRKKYEDPEILTNFFHKSQIFTGFPFFSLHAGSNNNNDNNKTEELEAKNEHQQEREGNNQEEQ